MNGIEKDIDSLGRVVIPMKFRKELGIEANSKILVSLEDGLILMSPRIKYCALCGRKIKGAPKFRLCEKCIAEVKAEK